MQTHVSETDTEKKTKIAKKQRVTFVKEALKPFSIMFEDACPLDLSITKYCTRPDAPILMADGSFKPIGELQVGDSILGWETTADIKKSRHRYVPSFVEEIFIRESPIIRINLASGRFVESTPDHPWFARKPGKNYKYQPVTRPSMALYHIMEPWQHSIDSDFKQGYIKGIVDGEGSVMAGYYEKYQRNLYNIRVATNDVPALERLIDFLFSEFNYETHIGKHKYGQSTMGCVRISKRETVEKILAIDPHKNDQTARGYLSAIMDGEGHFGQSIMLGQSSKANTEVYIHIKNCLDRFNFQYWESELGFQLSGGQHEALRFYSEMRPAVTRHFIKALEGKELRGEHDFVVSIEELPGVHTVVSMRTSTGNYINQGFASRNCFQGCVFCFSNLNREANNSIFGEAEDPTDAVIKLIQKANGPGYEPRKFKEWCVARNYPICFSNNVDPFMPASEEQFKCGERILQTCAEYGQRLIIQTKEVYYNDRIKQLLIDNRDIFQMYVSISSIDYDISQKYETVFIHPMERLRRIGELTKHGVQVCVGLNPYVPEWVPSGRAYLEALKAHGVTGIFTSPLHFSRKQKMVVDKEKMGQFVELSNRYDQFEEDMETVWRAMCDFVGLKLYYPTMQKRSMDFHHGITAFSVEETFPLQRGWYMCEVRKAWDEFKKPLLLTWDEFANFYSDQDDWKQPFYVDDIDMVVSHTTEQHKAFRGPLGKVNTFENMLKLIWNNPEIFRVGIDVEDFVYRKGEQKSQDEYIAETDENGNLMYVFDPAFDSKVNAWNEEIELGKGREIIPLTFGD